MAKALTDVGPDVMARMATEASARRLKSLRAAIVCGGMSANFFGGKLGPTKDGV